MKVIVTIVSFLISAAINSFSQGTPDLASDLASKIQLLRSKLNADKGLVLTEQIDSTITGDNKKEFVHRWKLNDSLTKIVVEASKWHMTYRRNQKRDVIETFFYRNGKLEYATFLDELKFKDGRIITKSGMYHFMSGKLLSKWEENNPEMNVELLLSTSEEFIMTQ